MTIEEIIFWGIIALSASTFYYWFKEVIYKPIKRFFK